MAVFRRLSAAQMGVTLTDLQAVAITGKLNRLERAGVAAPKGTPGVW